MPKNISTLTGIVTSQPKHFNSRFILGVLLSFLFSLITGLASGKFVSANSGSFTISAKVNSAQVRSPAEIIVDIRPSDTVNDSIVDIEIYNSSNQKVHQHFFERVNINSYQITRFRTNWTPQIEGDYQVKVGLFTSNWSRNFYWEDNALQFQAASESQPSSSSYLINTSTDSTPSVSSPLKLNTNITSPVDHPNAIVDVEVYDGNNRKIDQQYFENQELKANQNRTFTTTWTPQLQGDYKVKVGIFAPYWAYNHYWLDNSLSFNVGQASGGTQPTPIASVTPTPPSPTPTSVPTPSLPDSSNNVGSYEVGSDGKIYHNGNRVKVNGVSWFGFENTTFVAHGLWERNWKDMISQIKSTGFNAVRVPYCPGTLKNSPVSSIDYYKNEDLRNLNSLDLLDKFLTEMNNQKLHILLDVHTVNCQNITDLWYTDSYSEADWIMDLKFVADRYQNLDYFMGIDIKNEPKGVATWGTNDPRTDWRLAAQKAGREILSANPNLLIFVQGVQDNPTCSDNSVAHWWGGNFEPEMCYPIDNSYIPANKLVYSPHVYGPDVHPQNYFSDGQFPGNMSRIWDTHFGFLRDQSKSVVIGEYGGKYGHGGDPKDIIWQNAITDYFINKGICDAFYWSWNPNSGDTGGILQDDWKGVWQDKLDLINKYKSRCN